MFTKSYDVGDTDKKVLNLERELPGYPNGPHGKRIVVIQANEDNIYLALDKFVRKASKDYVPSGSVPGTGVDDVLSSLTFASPVDFDIEKGNAVDLHDTISGDLIGKAIVSNLSDDRTLMSLIKVDDFTYPTTDYAIRLSPSAVLSAGQEFSVNVANTPFVSLISDNATPSNNVTVFAKGNVEID